MKFTIAAAVASLAVTVKAYTATCNGVVYSANIIGFDGAQAYTLYHSGETIEGWPKSYDNSEGFEFALSGPYYLYPLLYSKVWTGGDAGTDRLVLSFENNGNLFIAGVVSDSGSGYTQCPFANT